MDRGGRIASNWPSDAGIAAWVSDDDGLWWRAEHDRQLGPGKHSLRFDFRAQGPARPVDHGLKLDQFQANACAVPAWLAGAPRAEPVTFKAAATKLATHLTVRPSVHLSALQPGTQQNCGETMDPALPSKHHPARPL